MVKHVHYSTRTFIYYTIKSMHIKSYYIVITLLGVINQALNQVECQVVWHMHMCTHMCVHDWIAGQLYNYGTDKVPQSECQIAIRVYDQMPHTNIT